MFTISNFPPKPVQQQQAQTGGVCRTVGGREKIKMKIRKSEKEIIKIIMIIIYSR